MAQGKPQIGKFGRAQDVVSQDRNWVLRINSQLQSQQKWGSQWGYLSGGFSPQKTGIKDSLDDKIKQLQMEINEMNGNNFEQTSKSYGKGQKVELFDTSQYNIQKNKDLRALERKLPKGWKKQKWTPPVDPFDPLSKMNKKR